MRGVAFLTISLLLTSCASMALMSASDEDVYSTASIGVYDYFWYYAQADPFHPLTSEKAEKYRIARFRRWLSDNGYESPEVEVVARRVERMEKKLGMKTYEIKYLMKAKQHSPEQAKEGKNGSGTRSPMKPATGKEAQREDKTDQLPAERE